MRPQALIVAGRAERDPRLGAALAAFAERAGAPLLAEPISGARRGPAAIAHYDALLRDPDVGGRARARARAALRRPPHLQAAARLARRRSDALQVAFDPESAWQDPAGVVATIVGADPRATLEALTERLPRKRKDTRGSTAGTRPTAPRRARSPRPSGRGLNEPRVAAELGDAAAARGRRWSSPPRCRSATSRRSSPSARRRSACSPTAARTGSTARSRPRSAWPRPCRGLAVLLIGDVALAHDIGGLLAARAARPEARDRADRQRRRRHLPLPAGRAPGRGLRRAHRDAARARLRPRRRAVRLRLGARRRRRRLPRRAAARRRRRPARTIICVRTDRERNVDLHRRVWESVRAAT